MRQTDAKIMQNFMRHIKNFDAENFIRSMLFCFCAPTIKGLKAACLINFRRNQDENMREVWKLHADEWLSPLKIEWLLLNDNENCKNALVLIYRRELLVKALGCDEACDILASKGYPLHDVDACLKCLREKFCESFPHEIGLFLDYPPCDVRGFMENRCAKNLACPGYWKVYGNVKKARETFRKYKQAECEAARLILAREKFSD